jgi:hypothetical protein
MLASMEVVAFARELDDVTPEAVTVADRTT